MLHIIPTLTRGGAEILVCQTVENLTEYEHVIVVLEDAEDELQTTARIIRLGVRMPQGFVGAIRGINKVVRETRPLIVNSHLYWPSILIRFSNRRNAKVFEWYHSDLFNPHNREQYSAFRLNLSRFTVRNKHHLIFVSRHLKESILKSMSFKGETYVLHNFVLSRFFEVIPTIKDRDALHILLVGNLRLQKNHSTLLQALKVIEDQQTETTIVGDGPLKKDLLAQVKSLNLKNVRFVGRRGDVIPYLQDADVFIMPSKFEGFGIALAEAMAAGVPCIVSDIPPFREIGGKTLIYFDPDDPKELADKILECMDLSRRTELSTAVKNNANKFHPEHYVQRLRAIYNDESN